MVIVGLETATSATAAAVLGRAGQGVERRDDPPAGARPGHAQRLLALLAEAMDEAEVTWDDVERIAVGVGPGGFTGLRIGVATARALAQARRLPLAGVSSLQALALGADHDGDVLAVVDARRGEVFAARFGPGAAPLGAPAALRPDAVDGSGRPLAVGDGAVRFRAEIEASGAVVAPGDAGIHRVSALAVCRLGTQGSPAEDGAVVPDYVRRPDAVPRKPAE